MNNNFHKQEKAFKAIREQLNYQCIDSEYIKMYHYTILKCLHRSCEMLECHNNDLVCFDNLLIQNDKVFSRILRLIKGKVICAEDIIGRVKAPFIDSMTKPSNNPDIIKESIIACYSIVAGIIFILKECDNEIKTDDVIYLPIEQECTIEYFINRYIKGIVLKPETIDEFNSKKNGKKCFYEYINSYTNHGQNTISIKSEDYSHAKKTVDNKKKILSRHHILGDVEDFSAFSLHDVILMLCKLDAENIRVQKLVNSPSSETAPFLGYSALRQKTARVSSYIFEYLPASSIYKLNSDSFESYFEVYEILRLLSDFTEGIYFGKKYAYFEQYIKIIKSSGQNITKENIPKLLNGFVGYVNEPKAPYEQLFYSTMLLKLASYVKETKAILQYILENRDALTNGTPVLDRKEYKDVQMPLLIDINDIANFIKLIPECAEYEMSILDISGEEWLYYKDLAYKSYKNLFGPVNSVTLIDHLACCQIIKSILNKKNKFKEFKCLNFYDRKTERDIFLEQYGRESQTKQTLSSMLKHAKFTTEDCMLIEQLINTQKFCLFDIDIFSVYQEILNVLKVLDYALTADKVEWASSPYKHLKAGEAILAEWGKVISKLEYFFKNTLNIDVYYI